MSMASTQPSLVEKIKDRLTLRDAAGLVDIELPPLDDVKFSSPLRPDYTPSCSIHEDVMHDWSTDESYDAIAFYAAAKGIENGEAIRRLAVELGIIAGPPETLAAVSFDALPPGPEHFAAIISTRNLPPEAEAGLVLANKLGVLHFAEVCRCPSWIVTDGSRFIAEARRIDRQPFPAYKALAERKVHTLGGSRKAWPCGLDIAANPELLRNTPVVLCEGGPDLLCAFALLSVLPIGAGIVQPVAMLGSSISIAPDALKALRGRPSIIVAHGDKAGRTAGKRRAEQLSAAGCYVKLRELQEGHDLNDLVSVRGLDETKALLLP